MENYYIIRNSFIIRLNCSWYRLYSSGFLIYFTWVSTDNSQLVVNSHLVCSQVVIFVNRFNQKILRILYIFILFILKAQVFEAVSQIVFLLMLILFAKGYTVTRGQLRKAAFIKLSIFFSVYLIAYIVSFVCATIVRRFILIWSY